MKFQNTTFIFLNGPTDSCTDKPKPICSPLFFKVGDIKIGLTWVNIIFLTLAQNMACGHSLR